MPVEIDSDRSFYLISTSWCFACENWSGPEESSHTPTHAEKHSRPAACAIDSVPSSPAAAGELRERRCGGTVGAAQATIGVTVCEPNRARCLQPLAPAARLPLPLRSQPCPHNLGSPAAWHCHRALLLPSAPALALPGPSWSGKLEGMMGMCLTVQVLDQT